MHTSSGSSAIREGCYLVGRISVSQYILYLTGCARAAALTLRPDHASEYPHAGGTRSPPLVTWGFHNGNRPQQATRRERCG